MLIEEKLSYKELAADNDIRYVVTGTVQESEEFIRVQYRVVEAASSETIFREQYDFRTEENMIVVKEQLAMYLMKDYQDIFHLSNTCSNTQMTP